MLYIRGAVGGLNFLIFSSNCIDSSSIKSHLRFRILVISILFFLAKKKLLLLVFSIEEEW